VIKAV